MSKWGKRKDGQAYLKDKPVGISGRSITTNPTGDVIIKEPFTIQQHYKTTNGFHHINDLKIDIFDAKSGKEDSRKVDKEFTSEVQKAWNESPQEIRNMVKRIVIKKVNSDNYKFEGRWNHKTRTLTLINFPNHSFDKVSGVTIHELAHVWFTEMQKNNNPAVLEYQKKTETINPVTFYSKKFYDVWQEFKGYQKKDSQILKKDHKKKEQLKRQVEFYRNEYFNEQHSETASVIDLLIKDYRGWINIDEYNTFKAIEFYAELHPEMRDKLVKEFGVSPKI